MPQITIDSTTYERLQRHAKPFVDTPDTVINLALDALDQLSARPAASNGPTAQSERRIDPRLLPSLTHTKVLDASIDGVLIPKANWNLLLDEILRRAMKRLGSFEDLRKLCPVNMVKGRKEDEGYSYLPDIDVSVQGQDANAACRTVVTAAQGLGIALDIGFMWRPKEGAAHPGERARIRISPRAGAVPERQTAA
ncbi:MAG: hypothetical protein KUL88_02555 [Rhizobium sp.]|jgi:hypothetical protein|nr:hypothetical protein [Rhizobium sp.]